MSELQYTGASIFIAACGIFQCGIWNLLAAAGELLAVVCEISQPGIEPGPPALGVLATGPPEKSLSL